MRGGRRHAAGGGMTSVAAGSRRSGGRAHGAARRRCRTSRSAAGAGLALIAIANALSRSGHGGGQAAFWCGILLIVVPAALRLAGPDAVAARARGHRRARRPRAVRREAPARPVRVHVRGRARTPAQRPEHPAQREPVRTQLDPPGHAALPGARIARVGARRPLRPLALLGGRTPDRLRARPRAAGAAAGVHPPHGLRPRRQPRRARLCRDADVPLLRRAVLLRVAGDPADDGRASRARTPRDDGGRRARGVVDRPARPLRGHRAGAPHHELRRHRPAVRGLLRLRGDPGSPGEGRPVAAGGRGAPARGGLARARGLADRRLPAPGRAQRGQRHLRHRLPPDAGPHAVLGPGRRVHAARRARGRVRLGADAARTGPRGRMDRLVPPSARPARRRARRRGARVPRDASAAADPRCLGDREPGLGVPLPRGGAARRPRALVAARAPARPVDAVRRGRADRARRLRRDHRRAGRRGHGSRGR